MSVNQANAIRTAFLEYFQSAGHERVASSSLVPGNDPTLLFTNSGMVQFKDVFLGAETRPYTCATTVQRCVRAGGKHNDLDQVGYTRRHHTFFEMLGNFSFGQYFKKEAICYAWDFLTRILQLPREKLWVTVYRDDHESEQIWIQETGIDPERIARCGEKDNFWQMGDTGPCGPCTEIFYDHGPSVAGGPPGSPEQDGDRYVEIWNLVFMQYERNALGKLTPLPRPCVDTGMGLERITAVMEGVHDNYDIGLFRELLQTIASQLNVSPPFDHALRVIADHIRSTAFLIMDGVLPSNEGRGYVLRRIMRRAIRQGYQLGQTEPFFFALAKPLAAVMEGAYPELDRSLKLIESVILQEEEQFSRTLSKGMRQLEQAMAQMSGVVLDGETVFQLYDTYGFPVDLTADIARERGLTVDEEGFQEAMKRQRLQSQRVQHFSIDHTQTVHVKGETIFVGYDTTVADAEISALLQDNKPVKVLHTGETGAIVLNMTPFYAESGGQIGDTGLIYGPHEAVFEVHDTQKQGSVFWHMGQVIAGHFHVDDAIQAAVNEARRQAIRLNHTATHLLHAALRRVLGEHVQQKGSLVSGEKLRFDFSHTKPLTPEELAAVEREVNAAIRSNDCGQLTEMTPEEAKATGAMALFGERYGSSVRVMSFGDFSREICGGTHAERTGDIGYFKIVSDSATAAGVRRIEAVTGDAAVSYVEASELAWHQVCDLLHAPRVQVAERLTQWITERQLLEKELLLLKRAGAYQMAEELATEAVQIEVGGETGFVLAALLPAGTEREVLRETLDRLRDRLVPAAIVLAAAEEEKAHLVASVSAAWIDHFKAPDLLNAVAVPLGGKGGGRPDMAQGGCQASGLLHELPHVIEWVRKRFDH
ncbi:MAG: alanine--tRNA ligase [Gammaproteobacteria bacterium RIFCSPHIGHO2_12_FULL_45_9]|nr:MAG: alanine--tRNA ligase [Gammaproteobacteria bacterium RIFCSPHIGHO2_12_FULL_45_9]